MTKLELEEGKHLSSKVEEASASTKTACTTCGKVKRKVHAHEKKLQL
jgi:hypothetical protein